MTPQAARAAILSGTETARRRFGTLDKQAVADMTALYAATAADLARDIKAGRAETDPLTLAAMQTILGQLETRLTQLRAARDNLIEGRLYQAAEIGLSPFKLPPAQAILSAERAAAFAREFIAADGLALSNRVWRIDRGAIEQIGRAIQSAVLKGLDASTAAEAMPSSVAGAARAALLTDPGNAHDKILRVMRTEMTRAHHAAFEAAAFEHPDVVGLRFTLSPLHRVRDICDTHATANRHGLGPGVYPAGAIPIPAHPHGRSYAVPVFSDEL